MIEALRGRLADHQRQLLQIHLDQIVAIDRALAAIDAALDRSLEPLQEAALRLTTIPSVGALAAGIIAEIRLRHEPVRHAVPSDLLGWALPRQR